jgi:hypothetical protein
VTAWAWHTLDHASDVLAGEVEERRDVHVIGSHDNFKQRRLIHLYKLEIPGVCLKAPPLDCRQGRQVYNGNAACTVSPRIQRVYHRLTPPCHKGDAVSHTIVHSLPQRRLGVMITERNDLKQNLARNLRKRNFRTLTATQVWENNDVNEVWQSHTSQHNNNQL